MSRVEIEAGLLRRMLEIRAFEEEVQRLFSVGQIRGTTHLGQGQEAVAVGACAVLGSGDTMTCTYRGHAAVLAMGAPLDRSFAEMMGKAGGLCGGKGGSMHLTDTDHGAMGSNAIVGAHLPISVGLAFASSYLGDRNVSVCFFGDGATNIGAFHEALNLASLWKLPVVYICENNLYGEYSTIASTTPVTRLVDRVCSYRMESVQVDGNDVLEMRRVAKQATDRARDGVGPTFIEALTYRQSGHSRSDPAKYRPPGELEYWLARDPIGLSWNRLLEQNVAEQELIDMREQAKRDVVSASQSAAAWPVPEPADRFEPVLK